MIFAKSFMSINSKGTFTDDKPQKGHLFLKSSSSGRFTRPFSNSSLIYSVPVHQWFPNPTVVLDPPIS